MQQANRAGVAWWSTRLGRIRPHLIDAGLAVAVAVLLINASMRGMPVHTGVRVIYADDESFTLMTPEGHPESGWNTFSVYIEKVCIDPKRQWSQITNLWYNAGVRSILYTLTAPLRWLWRSSE